jgi:hypothetical protein
VRVLAAFVSTLAAASLTGWTSGSGVAHTVTCRSIVVPGGTWCVPLVFRAGERATTVRFGIGKRF